MSAPGLSRQSYRICKLGNYENCGVGIDFTEQRFTVEKAAEYCLPSTILVGNARLPRAVNYKHLAILSCVLLTGIGRGHVD